MGRTDCIQTCGVCGEEFNRSDRQPVCLPKCGHTFCRACLVDMNNINREIKCPTCRTYHRGPPPEELPVNWTLMGLLFPDEEEKSRNNPNSSEVPPRNTREAPTTNHSDPAGEPDPKKTSKSKDSSGDSSENQNDSKKNTRNKILKGFGIAAASVVGGVGLVVAAPVVLTGVGFTSAGIAAGSWAAGMMSSAAIANGGGIAAGGLVALLQSAGAAGIGTAATATLGTAGAAGGAGIGYGFSRLFRRSPRTNENGNNGDNSDSPSKGKKGFEDDAEWGDQQGSPCGEYPPEGGEEGVAKDKSDDDEDSDLSDCEEKFSSMNLNAAKDKPLMDGTVETIVADLQVRSSAKRINITSALCVSTGSVWFLGADRDGTGISNHMIIQNHTNNSIRLHQYCLNWGKARVTPDANLPSQYEDDGLFHAAGGWCATGSSGIVTYELDSVTFLHILWDCPYNFNHHSNFIGLYLCGANVREPTIDLFHTLYQDVPDPEIIPRQMSPYDLVCCGPGNRTNSPAGRISWGFGRPCEVLKGNFYVSMTMGDSHKTSSRVSIFSTKPVSKLTKMDVQFRTYEMETSP